MQALQVNEIEAARERLEGVRREVGRVYLGDSSAVEMMLVALLARGHVLLEGVPGIAKTTLVKAFAATLGASVRRVQFTPDLLPADITGTYVLNPRDGSFSLRAGPISPTSCSPTRSTAPRRRRSPLCSRRCRNDRSRSRARLRDGKLERLTRDHSLVEEMRRKGQLTEAQAEDHPQRSIITRALGPEPEVEVDLQTVPAQTGDVFLICSDGLTTMLDDDHIARLLGRASTMQTAVRALVDEANRAGGRDNITVVAFRLEDAAAPARAQEGATLVGPSAEEAGLTATEVRRRAAADAARKRREDLAGRPRRRGLRRAATAIAAVVLVGAIAFGAWYGNRQVWFLGTDSAGRVSLYRGLPYELPLGVQLYDERYASPIQTEALPARRRGAVTGHDLRSREDAVSLLEEIQQGQGVP